MPKDKGGLALILGVPSEKKDMHDKESKDENKSNDGLEEAMKAAFSDFRSALKDDDPDLGLSALSALMDMMALSESEDESLDMSDSDDEDE